MRTLARGFGLKLQVPRLMPGEKDTRLDFASDVTGTNIHSLDCTWKSETFMNM